MKIRHLVLLSIVIVIISSIIIQMSSNDTDIKNISLGMGTSAFYAFIIDCVIQVLEYLKYSRLKGNYKRIKITSVRDKRDKNGKYEDITERYTHVNPLFSIKYRGDGMYTGVLHYEEGVVSFSFDLNKNNPLTAQGVYQYTEKFIGYEVLDIGTYEFAG